MLCELITHTTTELIPRQKHLSTGSQIMVSVTNFIRSYLHQIFDDSHSLKASLKPLRRPFDQCQSRLEVINIG